MMSYIESTPEISQRALSSHLGVAIGLVNTYLKCAMQKGWIKIQHIPAKRYAYYLTPKGFIEKTKLTGQYLTSSFLFFRDAQNQLMDIYETCMQKGWHHVLLVGTGELAEVALLVARKASITVMVVEVADFFVSPDFDCVIITDTTVPQKTFEYLSEKLPEDKILSPLLLHISRPKLLRREA